jgi:hypothetical protein
MAQLMYHFRNQPSFSLTEETEHNSTISSQGCLFWGGSIALTDGACISELKGSGGGKLAA